MILNIIIDAEIDPEAEFAAMVEEYNAMSVSDYNAWYNVKISA